MVAFTRTNYIKSAEKPDMPPDEAVRRPDGSLPARHDTGVRIAFPKLNKGEISTMKKLIAFLLMIAVVLSTLPITTMADDSSTLAAKLIAEYNFDDETTKDSIGSNDAALYNDAAAAPGVYTDGVNGKALQLSAQGTDEKYWLSVPYSAFGGSTDSFTLSLWYKASGYNTSGEDSELFSFYNSSAEKFLYYAPAATGFQDKAFTMKWDGTYGYANVITPYAADTWVHLVYAVSAQDGKSVITAYVNGKAVEVDQGGAWSSSLMSQLGIDRFTIGGKNPYKGGTTPSCLFYGQVDEIRLYAGALTAEEVAAIGEGHVHNYVAVVTAPTCTEQGYTTHTCIGCGDTYIDTYVPALGHDYVATVTAPTCTEPGYTTYVCSRCKDTYTGNATAALGHTWNAGVVTTAPTVAGEGVMTYTCVVCGATKTEAIAKLTVCPGDDTCPSKGFTDVPGPSNWAHAGIDFCLINHLFSGTTTTTFSPNGKMTRGMLVVVLWSLNGKTKATAGNPFTDVPKGSYYADAVCWAAENGIVTGVGNGKFNPQGYVTREQIAAIIFKYAVYQGCDTTKRTELSGFPDVSKVSAWAYQALSWANAEGLIAGIRMSDGNAWLQPEGNATRAQVAAIMMRYVQNIKK